MANLTSANRKLHHCHHRHGFGATRNLIALTITTLVISIVFVRCTHARGVNTPNFAGDALPEPPKQKEIWTPPPASEKLPEKLVSACATLFEQGLADPRGCEYRTIKITVGSVWGGGSVIETHGWVLPSGPNESQRFAVAWSGLIYPIVSVGEPADLKADVSATLKSDRDQRDRYARDHVNDKGAFHSFFRYLNAQPEESSTSATALFPLRACLLLRLGETQLASEWWEAWMAGVPGNVNNNNAIHDDPYLILASDWVWSGFDRLICSHMRGDDRLALIDARALMAVAPGIDAAAEKRGVKPPLGFARGEQPAPPSHYLNFLTPLPALIADQERRAHLRAAGNPLAVADKPANPAATPAERAAALVARLDEVSARQWGQPGGVILGEDQIVQELVALGDDAIEPLLLCLENDARLTRSVHFHRDFHQSRSVIGVHEAAYVALAQILQTSFFGPNSTGDDLTARGMEGRRAVAARIREHWNKFKGVSLEERWYRTLLDDSARPTEWAQAAGNIAQRDDVRVMHGSMFGTTTIMTPGGKPSPMKLRGDSLRAGKDPTVSQLLGKRLAALETGSNFQSLTAAGAVAKALSAWDGKAASKEMQSYTEFLEGQFRSGAYGQQGWAIAQLISTYQSRAALGDDHALDEYAAWIQTVRPSAAFGARELFQPMWRNPAHAAIAAAAEAMFNGANSNWNPLLRDGGRGAGLAANQLFPSPMLGVDGFRKQVLRMLEDKSPGGNVVVKEGGRIDYTITNGWGSGTQAPADDPRSPKPGTTMSFRACDACAFAVSGVGGLPECQLYWPEADRDAAVKRCAEILRQYGECFRYRTQSKFSINAFQERAEFILTPLDHPATPADVKAGRAIFSLAEGVADKADSKPLQGPVRLCSIPNPPLKATWTTLKTHTRDIREQASGTHNVTTRRAYDQEGLVWQAEEIQIAGQWRKFYGFVGNYDIARVAAEEIELPDGNIREWKQLSNGIDCALATPGVTDNAAAGTRTFTRLGVEAPVKTVLSLRNRRAVATEIPSSWYNAPAVGAPALRPGIELRLAYSGKAPDPELWYSPELRPNADWELTPARSRGAWIENQTRKALGPAASFDACELDLNALFDLSKPGTYRLQVEFREKENGTTEGVSKIITFQLGARAKVEKPR